MLFVGKVDSEVVGLGLRTHSILVSAMELALMGGWPTKDGRAGSEAFEFIPKGSGRKPGAAEAIFFARDLLSRNVSIAMKTVLFFLSRQYSFSEYTVAF